MRVQLTKKSFLETLSRYQTVIEKRIAIPILGQILLKAHTQEGEGFLTLTGTDLELTLQEKLPVQVEREGTVTVPGHLIHDVVRRLPDDSPVILDAGTESTVVSLDCGSAHFELPTLPAKDFPDVMIPNFDTKIVVSGAILRRLIDCTRFAMSTEEARYHLNGIYFHRYDNGKWCAVATDAHRLALALVPIEELPENLPGMIISRKTVQEVRKLVDESEPTVILSMTSHQMGVSVKNATLTARLVEGRFPDYRQVIPQDHPFKVTVAKNKLAEALARVSMMSDERAKGVRFELTQGQLTLRSQSTDYGAAHESLNVIYEEDPCVLGMNARYVMDILQHLKTEHLVMRFKDAQSPVLFDDPEDADVLYLVMPMRI